jgi:hypothetical protein
MRLRHIRPLAKAFARPAVLAGVTALSISSISTLVVAQVSNNEAISAKREISPYTKRECQTIFTTAVELFTTLRIDPKTGRQRFDRRFPDSLAAFIAPSNRNYVSRVMMGDIKWEDATASAQVGKPLIASLTCDGPREILTPGQQDSAGFLHLRSELLGAKDGHPISFEGILKSIDPTSTAVRPAREISPYTKKECQTIFVTTLEVITATRINPKTGKERFDRRFPNSLASFIAPSNSEYVAKIIMGDVKWDDAVSTPEKAKPLIASLTCDGLRDIIVPTIQDSAGFASLRGELLGAKGHPISFEGVLRAVDRDKAPGSTDAGPK